MKIVRKPTLGLITACTVLLCSCTTEGNQTKLEHDNRNFQVASDHQLPKSAADGLPVGADGSMRMWGSSQIGK